MKKVLLILPTLALLHSCALHSRTTIRPQKTFELGDGRHGAFRAVVKNDSETAVDVLIAPVGQPETKLLTLEPGQKKTVRVGADTKALFKNNTDKEAAVTLKVTGDTGLSMGGANYN